MICDNFGARRRRIRGQWEDAFYLSRACARWFAAAILDSFDSPCGLSVWVSVTEVCGCAPVSVCMCVCVCLRVRCDLNTPTGLHNLAAESNLAVSPMGGERKGRRFRLFRHCAVLAYLLATDLIACRIYRIVRWHRCDIHGKSKRYCTAIFKVTKDSLPKVSNTCIRIRKGLRESFERIKFLGDQYFMKYFAADRSSLCPP